jgi:YhcH/YjgK/YiaL family protein
MIVNKIENMKNYPILAETVEALNKYGFDAPKGSHKISDTLVLNVNEYNSNENKDGAYEAHEKWIDVQMIISGEEDIRYAKRSFGEMKTEYNPNIDALFMNVASGYDVLGLYKGNFAVFFPEDAHAPCRKSENADFAHKLVFKVKL